MSAVPLLYAAVGLVAPQPFFAISAVVYLALVSAPLAMFSAVGAAFAGIALRRRLTERAPVGLPLTGLIMASFAAGGFLLALVRGVHLVLTH